MPTYLWSSSDDRLLREELVAGGDWKVRVGAQLGRSRRCVTARCYLLIKRGELEGELYRARRVSTRPFDGWTAAEDAELRRLAVGPYSLEQIGERMGRTCRAVRWRLVGLGSKRKHPGCYASRWTEREDGILRRIIDGGGSQQEVVEATGRSLAAVRTRAAKLQPAGRRREWTGRELGLLRLYLAAGVERRVIAQKLGRSEQAVRVKAWRL